MKNVILLCCGLWLSACASYSSTTKGYQLSENVYRVEVRGTSKNDAADAKDYALLKAAEMTLDAGAKYFTIESAADKTKRRYPERPNYVNSISDVSGKRQSSGGNSRADDATLRSVRSSLNEKVVFVSPGVDVVITTYQSEPAGDFFVAEKIAKLNGPRLNPARWVRSQ